MKNIKFVINTALFLVGAMLIVSSLGNLFDYATKEQFTLILLSSMPPLKGTAAFVAVLVQLMVGVLILLSTYIFNRNKK
ncbi:MAG: hypothetical protein OEW60_00540 [Thiovulaceae bacterium]|nr:hypothetical protein [Sulfurimonadaceae bacterium]